MRLLNEHRMRHGNYFYDILIRLSKETRWFWLYFERTFRCVIVSLTCLIPVSPTHTMPLETLMRDETYSPWLYWLFYIVDPDRTLDKHWWLIIYSIEHMFHIVEKCSHWNLGSRPISSSCSIHYQVNRWLEFEQQVNFRQVRATHDGDFKGWNLGHDDGGGQDCSNRNLGECSRWVERSLQ